MKRERILIWICTLFGSLFVTGCGWMDVQAYPGPRLSKKEVATLFYPYETYLCAETQAEAKLILNEEPVKLPLGGDFHWYTLGFEVRLLPGVYEIRWSDSTPLINFRFRGHGSLDAKAGGKYKIHHRLKTGELLYSGGRMATYEVEDYATWITNEKTKEVIVGQKPSWVK